MAEDKVQREEVDRFSRFMFGERHTSSFEEPEKREKEDWDWILGSRESHTEEEQNNKSTLNGFNKTIDEFLQKVDYMEVMNHIDTLMTSTKELKPLLTKLKPLLENFLSKK
ncbi:hypothetical protein [Robertmurraya massiliosenegalensis]|uniref:hypothetical protein n=1 Tax=Robertmurraya massiliosenegalensis TaxID=1287657 RepID=UPI0003011EC9|nr:hypothetical protein [Robertmurraya massiliosenegalensis]